MLKLKLKLNRSELKIYFNIQRIKIKGKSLSKQSLTFIMQQIGTYCDLVNVICSSFQDSSIYILTNPPLDQF